MKFAIVRGQREEAQPNVSGECPVCGARVVAKCGEVRVWHWAHIGRRYCDPWWENETDWHRRWKNEFPTDWQEYVHNAADGERHIADVRTGNGRVLEFQHSYINPIERRSRESFYPKLVWVVDGLRRQRDRPQLIRAWNEGIAIGNSVGLRKAYSDDSALLREWGSSSALVFFDLGAADPLLWLIGASASGWAHLQALPRAQFLDWHRGAEPEIARQIDAFAKDAPGLIAAYESSLRNRSVIVSMKPVGRHRRFRL